MVVLYGRAGRLTAKNGGFGPGQNAGDDPEKITKYLQNQVGRGTWAHVTIGHFRHLAFQSCMGHRVCTNTISTQGRVLRFFGSWMDAKLFGRRHDLQARF
jgi:hypothetical protein